MTAEPFDPDRHLTDAERQDLADLILDSDAEQRLAAVRRRVLAVASAPWWLRAWWHLTGGPR